MKKLIYLCFIALVGCQPSFEDKVKACVEDINLNYSLVSNIAGGSNVKLSAEQIKINEENCRRSIQMLEKFKEIDEKRRQWSQ